MCSDNKFYVKILLDMLDMVGSTSRHKISVFVLLRDFAQRGPKSAENRSRLRRSAAQPRSELSVRSKRLRSRWCT